jgi:hypothetical protein
VEDLRRKYKRAIMMAKNAGLAGFIGERDGRLLFKGSVGTPEQAARIWAAIKDIPTWRYEVIADIQVTSFDLRNPSRGGSTGGQTA